MAKVKERGSEDIQQKIKRLAPLVDEFLEAKLEVDSPDYNWETIDKLGNLLNNELLGGVLPSYWEKNWYFECDTAHAAFDNPGLYTEDEISEAKLSAGTKAIQRCHQLLKDNFWEDFKKGLEELQRKTTRRKESSSDPGDSGKTTDQASLSSFYKEQCSEAAHREDTVWLTINNIKKKAEEPNLKIGLEIIEGTIRLLNRDINLIESLIDLISGLPIETFGKCKNDKCGKWFVHVTKHTREYCSRNCAARHIQKMKRERERDAYNQYHRERRKSKVVDK